jgi:copper chaperone CopZ
MRRLDLHVNGMRCRRCVREVTALLRDVPGVETVTADVVRSRVTVTGSMTVARVLHALAASDRDAHLVVDLGTATTGRGQSSDSPTADAPPTADLG